MLHTIYLFQYSGFSAMICGKSSGMRLQAFRISIPLHKQYTSSFICLFSSSEKTSSYSSSIANSLVRSSLSIDFLICSSSPASFAMKSYVHQLSICSRTSTRSLLSMRFSNPLQKQKRLQFSGFYIFGLFFLLFCLFLVFIPVFWVCQFEFWVCKFVLKRRLKFNMGVQICVKKARFKSNIIFS